MSDNQVKNKGAATQSAMPDGMDGRMRSLARRQAMSLGGKAGASISVGGKTGAGQAAAQTQSRPTVRASEVVAHPLPVAGPAQAVVLRTQPGADQMGADSLGPLYAGPAAADHRPDRRWPGQRRASDAGSRPVVDPGLL